ncbi:RHS repeat domain-containing protein [Thalassomonas actiniarum]|uniref:RHS repeat-associated core domain-containing protein n=1 Tax=Thalassomonas actiniarum TaxID=485447 RepID=A0AAE9YYW6_9GAMM|nr:RHS repeat-associated core domain-containing protein [Thalassomonas actiniarum]WDE02078.1 RHS repeat-associated core domain-containing protein [Thalassomonas actiniarum]
MNYKNNIRQMQAAYLFVVVMLLTLVSSPVLAAEDNHRTSNLTLESGEPAQIVIRVVETGEPPGIEIASGAELLTDVTVEKVGRLSSSGFQRYLFTITPKSNVAGSGEVIFSYRNQTPSEGEFNEFYHVNFFIDGEVLYPNPEPVHVNKYLTFDSGSEGLLLLTEQAELFTEEASYTLESGDDLLSGVSIYKLAQNGESYQPQLALHSIAGQSGSGEITVKLVQLVNQGGGCLDGTDSCHRQEIYIHLSFRIEALIPTPEPEHFYKNITFNLGETKELLTRSADFLVTPGHQFTGGANLLANVSKEQDGNRFRYLLTANASEDGNGEFIVTYTQAVNPDGTCLEGGDTCRSQLVFEHFNFIVFPDAPVPEPLYLNKQLDIASGYAGSLDLDYLPVTYLQDPVYTIEAGDGLVSAVSISKKQQEGNKYQPEITVQTIAGETGAGEITIEMVEATNNGRICLGGGDACYRQPVVVHLAFNSLALVPTPQPLHTYKEIRLNQGEVKDFITKVGDYQAEPTAAFITGENLLASVVKTPDGRNYRYWLTAGESTEGTGELVVTYTIENDETGTCQDGGDTCRWQEVHQHILFSVEAETLYPTPAPYHRNKYLTLASGYQASIALSYGVETNLQEPVVVIESGEHLLAGVTITKTSEQGEVYQPVLNLQSLAGQSGKGEITVKLLYGVNQGKTCEDGGTGCHQQEVYVHLEFIVEALVPAPVPVHEHKELYFEQGEIKDIATHIGDYLVEPSVTFTGGESLVTVRREPDGRNYRYYLTATDSAAGEGEMVISYTLENEVAGTCEQGDSCREQIIYQHVLFKVEPEVLKPTPAPLHLNQRINLATGHEATFALDTLSNVYLVEPVYTLDSGADLLSDVVISKYEQDGNRYQPKVTLYANPGQTGTGELVVKMVREVNVGDKCLAGDNSCHRQEIYMHLAFSVDPLIPTPAPVHEYKEVPLNTGEIKDVITHLGDYLTEPEISFVSGEYLLTSVREEQEARRYRYYLQANESEAGSGEMVITYTTSERVFGTCLEGGDTCRELITHQHILFTVEPQVPVPEPLHINKQVAVPLGHSAEIDLTSWSAEYLDEPSYTIEAGEALLSHVTLVKKAVDGREYQLALNLQSRSEEESNPEQNNNGEIIVKLVRAVNQGKVCLDGTNSCYVQEVYVHVQFTVEALIPTPEPIHQYKTVTLAPGEVKTVRTSLEDFIATPTHTFNSGESLLTAVTRSASGRAYVYELTASDSDAGSGEMVIAYIGRLSNVFGTCAEGGDSCREQVIYRHILFKVEEKVTTPQPQHVTRYVTLVPGGEAEVDLYSLLSTNGGTPSYTLDTGAELVAGIALTEVPLADGTYQQLMTLQTVAGQTGSGEVTVKLNREVNRGKVCVEGNSCYNQEILVHVQFTVAPLLPVPEPVHEYKEKTFDAGESKQLVIHTGNHQAGVGFKFNSGHELFSAVNGELDNNVYRLNMTASDTLSGSGEVVVTYTKKLFVIGECELGGDTCREQVNHLHINFTVEDKEPTPEPMHVNRRVTLDAGASASYVYLPKPYIEEPVYSITEGAGLLSAVAITKTAENGDHYEPEISLQSLPGQQGRGEITIELVHRVNQNKVCVDGGDSCQRQVVYLHLQFEVEALTPDPEPIHLYKEFQLNHGETKTFNTDIGDYLTEPVYSFSSGETLIQSVTEEKKLNYSLFTLMPAGDRNVTGSGEMVFTYTTEKRVRGTCQSGSDSCRRQLNYLHVKFKLGYDTPEPIHEYADLTLIQRQGSVRIGSFDRAYGAEVNIVSGGQFLDAAAVEWRTSKFAYLELAANSAGSGEIVVTVKDKAYVAGCGDSCPVQTVYWHLNFKTENNAVSEQLTTDIQLTAGDTLALTGPIAAFSDDKSLSIVSGDALLQSADLQLDTVVGNLSQAQVNIVTEAGQTGTGSLQINLTKPATGCYGSCWTQEVIWTINFAVSDTASGDELKHINKRITLAANSSETLDLGRYVEQTSYPIDFVSGAELLNQAEIRFQGNSEGTNTRLELRTEKFVTGNSELVFQVKETEPGCVEDCSEQAVVWHLNVEVVANDTPGITYVMTDMLGSPMLTMDIDGDIIKRTYYQPFGKVTDAPDNLENLKDESGYTGHIQDQHLGLTYMQARYYDPEIGRFYSIDPVGYNPDYPVHSFGRYTYVNNNPYGYTDPNGETALAVIGFISGGIAGGYSAYLQTRGDFTINDAFNVAKSAAVGATIGGLAGLTMGASVSALPVTASRLSIGKVMAGTAITNAISTAGGDATGQYISSGKVNVTASLTAGAFSVLGGAGAGAIKASMNGTVSSSLQIISSELGNIPGMGASAAIQDSGSDLVLDSLPTFEW